MCRKTIYLISFMLVLSLLITTMANAANIIWVSEAVDTNRDGVQDDEDFMKLVQDQGYTVDYRLGNWTLLNDDKIAELEAADLIIVSTSAKQGSYKDHPGEPSQWNDIGTPLICLNGYLPTNVAWGWMSDADNIATVTPPPSLEVLMPNHQIFTDVSIPDSNVIRITFSGSGTAFSNNTDVGYGTLIAKTAGNDYTWIAEFQAGIPFYDDGPTPGGKRMIFHAGSQNPEGGLNLNWAGQQIFLNAVRYLVSGSFVLAFNPVPEDGQTDVARDVSLSWEPGIYAQTHDVYFGTVLEDVNNADRNNQLGVLFEQGQDANTYDPNGLLDYGQTYFWRIDEVNAPTTTGIYKGVVWSFTTEPWRYPILGEKITATASSSQDPVNGGPINTINESGLVDDLHSNTTGSWVSGTTPQPTWIQYEFDRDYKLDHMLVWNYNSIVSIFTGYGIKDANIEYSTDGATWTPLGSGHQFAKATASANTTVDLEDVVARYVKITPTSNWSDGLFSQYGLSEVRFLYTPVLARYPNPDDGATDIALNAVLSWRAGREAAMHKVYFSDDPNEVLNGTAYNVNQTSFSPAGLVLGKTYYWMVEEVNDAETPDTWQGDTWSFSTHAYFVVDDIEGYDDEEENRIWWTWTDGYGSDDNGALIGYQDPYFEGGEHIVETDIVHGGKQSASFLYDNTSASYSEVSVNPADLADLAIGSDWTVGGATTLVLWVYGNVANTGSNLLYVSINGVGVDTTIDITKPIWGQANIDLTSLATNLSNVTSLAIGIEKAGGAGGKGTVFFDDIALYGQAPPIPQQEIWIEAEAMNSIEAPMLVLSDDTSTSGGSYIMLDPAVTPDTSTPPADGLVTYTFYVTGGIYRIAARVSGGGSDDSVWARVPTATISNGVDIHQSGWIQWGNWMYNNPVWGWHYLYSDNEGTTPIEFNMPSGNHTLEVRYREPNSRIDLWLITKISD